MATVAAGSVRYNWLKPGTKVRLWPEDSYAKYAVVKEINNFTVTFEIVEVEPGEPHYRVGHRVILPWSHIRIQKGD
ncbi:MAG: hypothetical protein ACOY46_12855 [Bacillota bacterium]